jgi:serine/threonine-protein kinase
MIGTTVGSYRVTQKVSVGGMGTVYRAEHTLIGRAAAVKVLHPELRANQEVVQRFFNEAKATTQIKHPGIVEIFDFGYLPSGDGYIVMEFLEGESLARRLESGGKMDEGEAAVLMRSVCSALAAAHGKGIIHRDLKPDNIFLCPDPEAPTGERPKLLDFGIAKLNIGLEGSTSATKTGAVMGTPTYMSPEQCRGTGEVDARSDLYSIGCMFYEMVAGRPPFENMAAGELIGAHLFIEPQSPRTAGAEISDAAEALIMQLIEKQPAKRVQTAQELGRRFAELAQGQGFTTRATPVPTANHKVTQRSAPLEVDGVAPTLASDPGLQAAVRNTPVPKTPTPGPRTPTPAPEDRPLATMTPTTLSGAASQIMKTPRSRAPLVAGLAAAFLVAGGAAFFAVSSTKSSSKAASQPAQTEPAATTPTATPPATTPAAATTTPAAATTAPAATATTADTPPVAPAETKPTTGETKPATAETKPTTAETKQTTETKPAAAETKPTTAETKPAATKPTVATKPTKPTKPSTTKPATTKPTTTKPTTTKPTTDKPKPANGSGSILIETDI